VALAAPASSTVNLDWSGRRGQRTVIGLMLGACSGHGVRWCSILAIYTSGVEQDLSVSPATPAPVIVVRDTIEGWRGFANSVQHLRH
jgi:hypothetical protein